MTWSHIQILIGPATPDERKVRLLLRKHTVFLVDRIGPTVGVLYRVKSFNDYCHGNRMAPHV